MSGEQTCLAGGQSDLMGQQLPHGYCALVGLRKLWPVVGQFRVVRDQTLRSGDCDRQRRHAFRGGKHGDESVARHGAVVMPLR